MNSNRNVTPVEDIYNLEDLDNKDIISYIPEQQQKVKKYIRNQNRNHHSQSGMAPHVISEYPYGLQNNNVFENENENESENENENENFYENNYNYRNQNNNYVIKKQPHEFSCLEVASHIDNCPICTRFYKNDNTGYIIVITILVIFCFLLLKKVLNI